ncbi:hypothetical protein B0H66DRAFT_361522 [Apodospora peruviana]|uniref:DUF7137 domain-containing protein n=1 Tax=Apodospora peruviana TaxID=516989 RepID=A0AAE0HXH1_9PEZI|nr:hypothetical protein B0H66DRAFT_361522 [Apodospora peruviana]
MKATRSVGQLAVVLLSLTPVVSASAAWPRWLPELDALVVRQNEDTSSPTPTPTATPAKNDATDATTTDPPTKTGKQTISEFNFNTAGISKTDSESETETGTKKGGKTTTKAPKHTQFPPQDPPGAVVMLTPAPTAGSVFYKIGGEPITWGWNYTSLQGKPTAVDVLISCATATRTWTLTQNMTFETKASYTWDTKKYKEENKDAGLLTELYQLLIHDSDTSFSDVPEAGYLAPFSGFQFGLYEPQDYVSIDDGWTCATCSGAMSYVESRAVGGALAMSIITVLSFTWFVAGFGAFL